MAFQSTELLNLPKGRAAYSDRTAWMLAEMSRVAYEKFEGNPELIEATAAKLSRLQDAKEISKALSHLVQEWVAPDGPGKQRLVRALSQAGFDLVQTFNLSGTQAFLARRDSDRIAVLAFRGTEMNGEDIKADLNVRFYERGDTKIHTGFRDAFELVREDVVAAVSGLGDYQLFITGHSLGGAIAVIAAKELDSDRLAACYTYGCPKVGNTEFGEFKAPHYRIVNAADAVPRVPPGWPIEILIVLAHFVPIPYLRNWLVDFLKGLRGYRHSGDMHYLSECKSDFSDVHVISNPEQFDRAVWLVRRVIRNWSAPLGDHRIAEYCSKLENYAIRRTTKK